MASETIRGRPSCTSLCDVARPEEVGQAIVWLICTCVGKLRNVFFSKVKRGQGEQLEAPLLGSAKVREVI